MGRYQQPRAINSVSLLLLAGLALAGYGAYRFVPVYVRNARIQALLSEYTHKYWKLRNDQGYARLRAERELRGELERKIRDLGVDDEDLEVTLTGDKVKLTIEADYTVVIEHPYIRKYTVLRFHPSAQTDVATPW